MYNLQRFNYRYMSALCAVTLFSFGALPSAFAQTSSDGTDDGWRFTAGAGLSSRPKYSGSDETKTQFIPVLSASYGRYFLGSVQGSGSPFGLGAYLYRDDHARIGVAVGGGFSKARKESDSDRLHGLGDIDNTTRASIFSSYTIDWFTIRNSLSSDVGGNHQGILFTLDLEGKYHVTPSLSFTAGPGMTWADSDYTQTFFGIDSEQSARSGRQIYEAKSGVNSLRFSVGSEYMLSKQWMLGARVTLSRLHGDAAESPITARKSQNAYGVFASYRF